MKVILTLWFSGMYGFTGIVLGENVITGERKALIGVHQGVDPDGDTRLIVEGGSKIPRETLKKVLAFLDKEEASGDKVTG